MRKPEIHQSQVHLYSNCGMQYYFRYVLGIKSPPGVAMVTGTGTHRSVEQNLRSKLINGKLLEEDEVADIAADAVKRTWAEEGVVLDEEERECGEEAVKGKAVDMAVSLSKLHHRELAPIIQPVALERQFTLELPNHPVNLAGSIDVEEADSVRDTKTFKKMPSADEVDRSIQLSMYGLAKRTLDKTNPKKLCLDVLTKTKEPKAVVLTTTRNDDDYRTLLRRIEIMVDAIDKGVFIPTVPGDWRCSEKFCGFYKNQCPFGARKQVTVAVDGIKE